MCLKKYDLGENLAFHSIFVVFTLPLSIYINFNLEKMMLNSILAFFNLGTGEILLVVLVVLLLFGGKKIPELMKGLGKGVKSFKQGMNEVEEEIKKADPEKENEAQDEATQ